MSFDSFLYPRREVIDESIEGIVDLANIQAPGRLESEPNHFFSITYPTNDIARIIQALDTRFSSPQTASSGLYLFEGLKGSGKSHLLLLIYHLFRHPAEGEAWLASHNLTCRLPRDGVLIVNKFTDEPTGSIWDLIYKELIGQPRRQGIVQPGLEEMKDLIGDRCLVLILDELERGIQSIGDSAVRAQNLSFLQMLSEWANRSTQITLFTSIYNDEVEPGSTLKRVSPVRVQFQHASDRARVVLYRLFENYLTFDPQTVRSIVDSYINIWRRHISFNAEEYVIQMLDAYPFSPDLLTLLLDRVPTTRGGFQNVRGALGFLAHLVRLNRRKANLITAGLAPITDREVALRLSDLDPNSLIKRARNNLRDLEALRPIPPLVNEVASATILYTLSGTGRNMGTTREELIRSALQPGGNINDFERTLLAMQRYAANYHVVEGRYFFDQTETPDSKVELRALGKNDTEARTELRRIWLSLFNSPNAVVFTEATEAREAVDSLDRSDLRFVLTPRTLSAQERHDLYYGLSQRNQVILLEPGDKNFKLNEHPDLLKWAKRYLSAGELADLSQSDARRAYEGIKRTDQNQITDTLKRVGLRYVYFESYGSGTWADLVDEEMLGRVITAEEVRNTLSTQFYPSNRIMEHLRERLPDIIGRSVREIEQEYKSTLGFPVPAKARSVTEAIVELCADQRRLITVRHPTRGPYCGQRPQLSHTELMDAVIEDPIDLPSPSRPTTVASPRQESRPYPSAARPSESTETGQTGRVPATGPLLRDIRTLPQPSPGQLRQEIASRLQDSGEVRILQARFIVVIEQSSADLGRLSSGLRGTLTGQGDLFAEISLTFKGEYTKAAIEKMAEQLPVIPGAEYETEIRVVTIEG